MRLKAHKEQQQFLPRQSGTYHATKLYTVFHRNSYFRNFFFNLKAGCSLPVCSRVLATPQWQYGFVAANHPSEFCDSSLRFLVPRCM